MKNIQSNAGSPSPDSAGPANGNGVRSNVPKNNDPQMDALLLLAQNGRLGKILHMIESQPSRTIQDLALECNLSGSRLQHLFKQYTGLGLGHLLNEQRMRQALELLVHTNMSMKEIGSALGYEHASSFTRAFERRFRQPPSFYRQAQSLRKTSSNRETPHP